MPYINDHTKKELKERGPRKSGELNYLITEVILEYLEENGKCYQVFNDCVGALEGAKLELYRRMIGPYEDIKIKENGDVYP